MGKSIANSAMDAELDYISSNANQIHSCVGEPTTRAEAVSTFNLASGSIGAGDFTKANGDVSGRKNTVAAQTGLAISSSGNVDHVAITSATELLQVTTATPQQLTAGGTVDTPAFDHEIGDPV